MSEVLSDESIREEIAEKAKEINSCKKFIKKMKKILKQRHGFAINKKKREKLNYEYRGE